MEMQKCVKSAAMDITAGGTSIYAGFAMLDKMTHSAREFNKATGDLNSLNVLPEELAKAQKAAKSFAKEYGGSATEVLAAAYEIQGAIPGLIEGGLAAFSKNAAILGKATKATADDMTNYMGTMYAIFEKDANEIGQAEWVDALTGKTAHAIDIFKTSGGAMNAAFANLGSTATLMGVDINEQIAALGVLQGTMEGAVAGSAYRALMSNMAKGQSVLGINLKDDSGNLLPLYEMMERISGAVDGLDKDQQVAKLTQAFGKQGALAAMNMLSKTDMLRESMESLGAINTSDPAVEMAQKMTDAMERFKGVWDTFKISIGAGLLPVLNGMLTAFSEVFGALGWLLDACPPLRWAVVGVTMALFTFMVALGVVKIGLGIASGIKALSMGMKLLSLSTWLFNGALWACPITWIVVGIIALIAGVALLIIYWDKVTAFVWKYIDVLLYLLGPIGWVIMAFRHWDKIVEIAKYVWASIVAGAAWLWEAIQPIVDAICTVFGGAWEWISNSFWAVIDSIIKVAESVINSVLKIWNKLTGSDIKVDFSVNRADTQISAVDPTGRVKDAPAGGFRGTTNNTNYGGVTINTATMPTPGQLEEYLLLNGGA